MPFNGAQFHLAFIHFPIVLSLLALAVCIGNLFCSASRAQACTLGILVFAAASSAPAYFSGEFAEDVLEQRGREFKTAIHEHEERAEIAFILNMSMGLLAAFLLYLAHRRRWKLSRAVSLGLCLGQFVTVAVTLSAAHLGGEIRHPEITLNNIAIDDKVPTSIQATWKH